MCMSLYTQPCWARPIVGYGCTAPASRSYLMRIRAIQWGRCEKSALPPLSASYTRACERGMGVEASGATGAHHRFAGRWSHTSLERADMPLRRQIPQLNLQFRAHTDKARP